MDKEQKIAEIREALEKATPGPWKIDEFGAVTDRKGNLIQWYDGKVVTAQKEDAHLIANAPEWLRFLLDELDSLRESLEEWRGDFEELRKDRDRMREEREELIEELKHYADRRNYPPLWLHEDGQKARNILKKIGVTVE